MDRARKVRQGTIVLQFRSGRGLSILAHHGRRGSSSLVSPFSLDQNPYVSVMSVSNDRGSADSNPIIVGIGASAGGVQALQILFDALPDGTGASFVVIVHLDPQAHSDLASILASRTRMPVVQVQTREEL
jgi:chemotaxis response regulator CheB